MNDIPRQKLCGIVSEFGHNLCDDPRRIDGLLKDPCGEHKREIFVLVSAIKEGVPADLMAVTQGLPTGALVTRLAQRLCDNLALSEAAALWAVETWAVALGILSLPSTAVSVAASTGPRITSPVVVPPEKTLRSAVYIALKAGTITAKVKAELRELRQNLTINRDAANVIYKEVQLQLIVEFGDLAGAQRLLSENPRLANAPDTDFGTVLHRAYVLHGEIAKLLLASGANGNTTDGDLGVVGRTALHAFVYDGRTEFLKLVIANGANLNATTRDGFTALWIAFARGRAEAARILISSGADVSVMRASPLHWAPFWGVHKDVSALLAAETNVNARDVSGATPLHWAAEFNRIEVIRSFIEKGAEVNARTLAGATPLSMAIFRGHVGAARELIARGADRSAINWTPLHWAALCGNQQVASDLIANGADVNMADADGRTPLHWAVMSQQPEVVALLIAQGADVRTRDFKPDRPGGNGKSPFDILSDRLLDYQNDVQIEIARLLVVNGALDD